MIKVGERREKLFSLIDYFNSKKDNIELEIESPYSKSPIQTIIIPGNDNVKEKSKILLENKIDVRAILSPTVPEGKERLRICLHSFNSEKEMDRLFASLK